MIYCYYNTDNIAGDSIKLASKTVLYTQTTMVIYLPVVTGNFDIPERLTGSVWFLTCHQALVSLTLLPSMLVTKVVRNVRKLKSVSLWEVQGLQSSVISWSCCGVSVCIVRSIKFWISAGTKASVMKGWGKKGYSGEDPTLLWPKWKRNAWRLLARVQTNNFKVMTEHEDLWLGSRWRTSRWWLNMKNCGWSADEELDWTWRLVAEVQTKNFKVMTEHEDLWLKCRQRNQGNDWTWIWLKCRRRTSRWWLNIETCGWSADEELKVMTEHEDLWLECRQRTQGDDWTWRLDDHLIDERNRKLWLQDPVHI